MAASPSQTVGGVGSNCQSLSVATNYWPEVPSTEGMAMAPTTALIYTLYNLCYCCYNSTAESLYLPETAAAQPAADTKQTSLAEGPTPPRKKKKRRTKNERRRDPVIITTWNSMYYQLSFILWRRTMWLGSVFRNGGRSSQSMERALGFWIPGALISGCDVRSTAKQHNAI